MMKKVEDIDFANKKLAPDNDRVTNTVLGLNIMMKIANIKANKKPRAIFKYVF
jgi:hypothetical protein